MKKLAALAGVAVLGLSAQTAFGYGGTATVTFTFGGNSNSGSLASVPYSATADVGWTSNGTNTLSAATNSTYFTTLGGYNSLSYYNPDFASTAGCAPGAGIVPPVGTTPGQAYNSSVTARKYGCRWNIVTASLGAAATFSGSPVTDPGPVGGASGTLTVTDTTLSGTLTIISTTDEPTGGTATSIGNGTNGYNYRTADGSPFGNSWNGITTAGTLAVALTGTFTGTSWSINGGSVKFTNTGFLCQQGGSSTPANILCSASTAAGGFQTNGASLSWGWDVDGAKTGTTAITAIDVRDAAGSTTLASLAGVLASLSLDGLGNITTNSGEFRRALGSAGGGCGDHIRYDGTKIACGTLTAGKLVVTGTAPVEAVIPVPAAVWFAGSALGLLGALRRKKAA